MRTFYNAIFENLARSNKQILHTDSKTAFYLIKDIYNPDAFDNAIRSLGKTPCLLLENYRTSVGDASSRNYFKEIKGRFDVYLTADPGDQTAVEQAYDDCEAIADDILAKLRELFQEGNTVMLNGTTSKKFFFPVQQIEIDPVGPVLDKYYGVSVGFTMKFQASVASDPAKWS